MKSPLRPPSRRASRLRLWRIRHHGHFNWSRVGGGEAPLGDTKSRTQVPGIVDWYMRGKINIDDLITHTPPLERINEGFDLMQEGKMHEGKSIRMVVTF